MVMARRTQTLVQLTDELVALLDERAARQRRSRSDLIREAIEGFLGDDAEAHVSRQIVAGYERIPQEGDDLENWARRGALDLIDEEPW
jgi:metal-responsive CopG/Arc/MetJ family transcriptional regulator